MGKYTEKFPKPGMYPCFDEKRIKNAVSFLRNRKWRTRGEAILVEWYQPSLKAMTKDSATEDSEILGVASLLLEIEDNPKFSFLDAYMLLNEREHLFTVLMELRTDPDRAIIGRKYTGIKDFSTIDRHYMFVTWSAATFAYNDYRIYEVSLGLAQQLAETDLRGMTCSDLRLPFPTICIKPPALFLDSSVGMVTAIVVQEECSRDEQIILELDLDLQHRYWTIIGYTNTDQEFFVRIGLGDDERTTEDALEITTKKNGNEVAAKKMFRFVMNTVVYATHTDAEVEYIMNNPQAAKLWKAIEETPEGTRRRVRLQEQFDQLNTHKTALLGRNVIHVSREEAEKNDAVGVHGKKLHVRFRVAGFWRRQPYGPMSSLRRLTWIRPFWRGPEWGTVKPGSTHVLGKDSL